MQLKTKQHSEEKPYIQLRKVVSRMIDDIILRGGAHTQKDSKLRILNLTGSEPHPHVSAINFSC